MVRAMVVTATSLALTTAVVAHAYYLKHQFYPTVVYLTKSSPSMAFMRKVFFGQLRAAEMEVGGLSLRSDHILYPDATPEELQATDNVCIICREEMLTGAKRLPCNHIFHSSCLRSWFQRQQTCPTCRMDVLRAALPNQTQAPPPAQQQAPPPPQHQPAPPPANRPPNAAQTPPETTQPSGAAPWMGMPPPPPFGMPSVPLPPAGFSGLSEAELRLMEGHERRNLEARLQTLQNIHTLLDAAMLQINQYLSVLASMGYDKPVRPVRPV
ncbi:UNVERIFIED_CONTAM: hypothetical protein FKN15_011504 [Acipenser sinensis]